MSAVSVQAPLLHYTEALAFWEEFTLECRRHVKAINAVVLENQLSEDHGVTWKPSHFGATMTRDRYPSTEINLQLTFEHWGPHVSGTVRGFQEEDLRFYPEEFEFTIAPDGEGRVIAITAEGRSLTPHELAKYVAQNFRRCFPGLSLPCPDTPLDLE